MKIVPATLLLLLAPYYAIEARHITSDGPPANQSPTRSQPPDLHRFIVRYKNEEGKANVHTAADKLHADLGPQHAIAVTLSTPEALESLQNNSNIEYVEKDYPRYPMTIMRRRYDSNDFLKQHVPYNNETHGAHHRKLIEMIPYGIPMVQADQVSYDSRNPRTVCIIDTGYNLGHEDLPSTNVNGYTFDRNFPWNQDGTGHGTHVAGTIAALSGNGEGVIGVAPGVNLFIIRVFADDGSFILASDLVDAANRCKAAGANVISMSLGGGGFDSTENSAFASLYTNDNILIVAAAGNNGNTDLYYPASYNSVVSVAAIGSNKVAAEFSQRNNRVDIAAPGVSVLSTVPMGSGVAESTLVVSGVPYFGIPMRGTASGSVSGFLVDCGLGVNDCTAARGQICLIRRGEIFFSDKVLACQNGGGLGAVVYNNIPGDLAGDLVDVVTRIPSIGISDTDGEFLLANKLGNIRARLTISGVSNYAYFDGTSMACPHVSAVAALIWSHDPTRTARQVGSALQSTAEDLGVPGKDNSYGHGLVQAAAACSTLTGSSCTLSNAEPSAGPSLSSSHPSGFPSEQPSLAPTSEPSTRPSRSPSASPSDSAAPSSGPSSSPSTRPSSMPSSKPSSSSAPSSGPSSEPSTGPSRSPSASPSVSPAPSSGPSLSPSTRPSAMPSSKPSSSSAPSSVPSSEPSTGPSRSPSALPSSGPSLSPSTRPSAMPSSKPSSSSAPSSGPSSEPSTGPSRSPSASPSVSAAPSSGPSSSPSTRPSSMPSNKPSSSIAPSSSSRPSSEPSSSSVPSSGPSSEPSITSMLDALPSDVSAAPISGPTSSLSVRTSSMPSSKPTSSNASLGTSAETPLSSSSPTHSYSYSWIKVECLVVLAAFLFA